GRSERHRRPSLQAAQGQALRDPTEAPLHGIVKTVSGSACFLQSRPNEPVNRCPPYEVSALRGHGRVHRRRSELRCREPRAQFGKERGLLPRSAFVPQPVAPRKQASAARWVFAPHLLESEARRECSGPKFPWDVV